jgi:glyoxylase-like metal-dependent hydrolase (beta-lactamase superfamily II)/8-oxo-dGTP pyrophosphatase MutT (NUDIX family)
MKPLSETPTTATPVAVPRRAATLIVVRDGEAGMEVLLLRRVERSGDRSSGAFVFPGGTLDAADGRWHAQCAGLDDAQASRRLGVASGGLDYYVAAIRECFEEAGVLLACDTTGDMAALDAHDVAAVDALRAQLRRGASGLGELCERLGLRLAADRLAYHSHWLTPPGLPKRFDTRFFIARMPPRQTAALHSEETLEHCWMRPSQALERAAEMRLPNPTRRTLQSIAGFASADDCIAHAQGLRDIRRIMPLVADGPQGLRPVHPDEPMYAEIGRLDPQGAGHARYTIEPGRAVRLSPRVWRLTAPNPGVMTGPGTNTYLVGGNDAWAVIDPGPDDEAHVQATVAAAPGPIRHILVTHTHRDHSPAARRLQALTGAELLGLAAPDADGQDVAFVPDRSLRDGELLRLGPDASLRVIHTPGHASNHLCYLLLEEKTLFTGDHVMQGSTVVINPPDGDMAAYLASLQSLQGVDLDWLAPGHGFLMDEPRRRIEALIRHRRAREAKVVEALRALGPASLGDLLARVYDDVPQRLHPVAARSLLAHLRQLAAEGRALEREGCWSAAV